MERRHYSVNHPAVRQQHREASAMTLAERRSAVLDRSGRRQPTDWIKVQAIAGVVLVAGTGLAFDSAESGGSWLLVGLLGTCAGTCLLNAIRQIGS